MEIWYAIPSANYERCSTSFEAWKGMGYKTAVLLDKGSCSPRYADLVIDIDPWPGYYQSFNLLHERIGEADIIITGGDDIMPDFNNSAEKIGAECFKQYPDGFFVMQPTGDALPGRYEVCMSPWIGKGWLRRAYRGQHPVWPEYMTFFGDKELKEAAQMLGVLWWRNDLLQFHDHWSLRKNGRMTDYQARNEQNWKRDEDLFYIRQKSKFPGHEPLAK